MLCGFIVHWIKGDALLAEKVIDRLANVSKVSHALELGGGLGHILFQTLSNEYIVPKCVAYISEV
jgi:hypothetical protein